MAKKYRTEVYFYMAILKPKNVLNSVLTQGTQKNSFQKLIGTPKLAIECYRSRGNDEKKIHFKILSQCFTRILDLENFSL